jgi:hypothetical protein
MERWGRGDDDGFVVIVGFCLVWCSWRAEETMSVMSRQKIVFKGLFKGLFVIMMSD